MIVLRHAEVLAPEPLGRRDVVIAGETIVALIEPGVEIGGLAADEHDLEGLTVVPGFIDNHVHVLGGGGGLGFASRAPELQTSQLVRAGITSVIGMLGFDATSKDMRALVAKTKAFKEDGISAYALTGATLEHPVPTLTGRIRDDIAFVEEIIGVGEISVSELGYAYDSNGPGAQYVAEAATAGLLAGRLARKRGYLCLQVPPYHGACLKPVMNMLDRTGLPIAQLLPSHVNQTDAYMADATLWARRGGYVDVGANYSPENNFSRATPPAKAVIRLLEAGVPLAQILLSSDGNGAPPKEEQREGQPAVANYMPVGALHGVWQRLIVEEGVAASDALRVVTSNPADATGLRRKGRIAPGQDADLIAFDADWQVRTVIARGRVMVERGAPIRRGMFDRIILDQLS
ncbi:MAG: beta-aspartyl-peptidase [Geminicoccaceae bacterium]|nr:beta-aspartyl-peptidase [Geminicoccaceae bacterium]